MPPLQKNYKTMERNDDDGDDPQALLLVDTDHSSSFDSEEGAGSGSGSPSPSKNVSPPRRDSRRRRGSSSRFSLGSSFRSTSSSGRRRSSLLEYIESLEEPPESVVSDDDPAVRRQSFIRYFASSRGAPQVIFLCMLLALALGSTVGVVPAVVTDRYARLNHGYDGGRDCADYGREDKPVECLFGSADAQNAAAAASFVSNGLTFVTSSLVGSISDERGRRGILVIGILLSLLGPTCLVLLQYIDAMSPTWYYAAHTTSGLVNWVTIGLSALSDVMPKKWRAPCFGLLLAGFSLGFALSPSLALTLSHRGVSILALSVLAFGFLFALCCLPETLPREVSEQAVLMRAVEGDDTTKDCVFRNLMRPMRELSILNRNRLFRTLSALAFFSGMSSSADHSLLLYYCQERLEFNDGDVALMFMIMGVLGIFVQGVVLKPLVDCLGEKLVVVVAFLFGAIHNVLYGLATTKGAVFAAVAMATITGVSFPTISAIKSNNVEEHEQGRIQGALYSLSSLASAVGPVSLRVVYHYTRDNPYPGPGTMFVFAGALYMLATCLACALPKDVANSNNNRRDSDSTIGRGAEEECENPMV